MAFPIFKEEKATFVNSSFVSDCYVIGPPPELYNVECQSALIYNRTEKLKGVLSPK